MGETSIPRMFFSQAQRLADKPSERVKRSGAWVDLTWTEVAGSVREIAYGLLGLGMARGDAAVILSATRPEWVHCDLAIQAAGGIAVPIYPSENADHAAYIVNDSEAKFLIVENKAQLDKIFAHRSEMPTVKAIIAIDRPGDAGETVLSLDDLKATGRGMAGTLETLLEERLSGITREDVATIVYTSGTTGTPKGVIQTHGNHLSFAENAAPVINLHPGDVDLLFLPLAHVFARSIEYFDISVGAVTAFAESLEKLPDNMVEVRPDSMSAVPRVFEKAYAAVLAQGRGGSRMRRLIFDWAMEAGRRASRRIRNREPLSLGLRIARAAAQRLVFGKIQARFGGRVRFCISGGAPLSREIAEFFHAAGILILEGYGLTETCPATHINRYDRYKFGTVGLPIPGVEVRQAEDGEVLVKGPNIASRGYYRMPQETRDLFTGDGWLKTGDIGTIDPEGFLTITDRKKDLIKTAGGKFVAPQSIENMIKADPLISQAVVIGDRRPYCVALIAVGPAEASKAAGRNGGPPAGYEELAADPRVRARVGEIVDRVNSRLASFETVKKFALVPMDFTQDNGQLTPTLKVKRRIVAEKYRDVIEGLYAA